MKSLVAKIISAVFALPVMVFLIIYGVSVAGFGSEQFRNVLFQLLLLEIIIPFGIFAVLYHKGLIKDIDVIDRKDRILPFCIGLACFVAGLFVSMQTGSATLFHFQLVMFTCILVSFLITLFWKISLHAGVVTSAVVLINVFSGMQHIYLALIIPIVYWSRLYLKRHTHGQLVAGIVVNLLITTGILAYFNYI